MLIPTNNRGLSLRMALLTTPRLCRRLVIVISVGFLSFVNLPSFARASETDVKIAGAQILSGTITEGGLITAKVAPGTIISVDGTAVPVTSDGFFVIGFHRDHDTKAIITIRQTDGTTQQSLLMPTQRVYDIQRIDGLATKMVTPPASRTRRIQQDAAAVYEARTAMPPELDGNGSPDFFTGFDWPIIGRISGDYGGQRILNGKARQPHFGIDIAAPLGAPVLAPADGVVTLVDDLYYSGWTVIMAHGLGVNSGFLHLDEAVVDVGTFVPRGTVIGHVGSSGRSTGPHLDWRIDWQGRRMDAGLAAGPIPTE